MTSTETDPHRAARADGPVAVPARGLPEIEAGRYEMLDEIARGGMGRILRARDRLGRIVAVKRLLDASPNHVALFEREVRIIARLSHPSIVSVIEAGILPDGERMYVMRLVPGRTLRDVLREQKPVKARLGLLPIAIAVADALAYAHAQGVIHRDLKPGNVLVGEFGEVVVIDWGLAHDIEDDTTAERVMGTPAYMPPEAARGEAVDERADVYAIGAILYETLAGAPPYGGEDGAEILAAVRAGPPPPVAVRAPGTPADLAAIVDKAMARDPAARYPSAKELADELRRFATGQLVSAHAYSLADRLLRWARRRAVVKITALSVAIVIVLTVVGVSRIVHERDIAEDRAESLTLARARLELDRDPAEALATLDALPEASPAWSAARTIAADAIARGVPRHARVAGPVAALAFVDGAPRALVQHDDALEVVGLGAPASAGPAIARLVMPAQVATLAPDGRSVAAIGDGKLAVWRDGARVLERPGPRVAPLVALSPDGALVAAAGRDFGSGVWRIADGSELARDEQARELTALAIDDTGAVVPPVVRSRDGTLALRTGDGALAALDREGHRVRAVSTSQHPRVAAIDERGAFAIADRQDVWWWDPADPHARRVAAASAPAIAVVAAAGGAFVIAEDGSVWRLEHDRVQRLGAHVGAARALARAGDTIVTTGDDRAVRRWTTSGAQLVGVQQGPGFAVAVARDGTIASGGVDRLVRVWRGSEAIVLGRHEGAVRAVAWSANGQQLASFADDRTATVWTPGGGPPRHLVHPVAVTAIAWAGEAIVTGARDGQVRYWSGTTARTIATHAGAVRSIAVHDGHVATAGDDGRVGLGDTRRVALHGGHTDLVRRVVFAPHGRVVASASEDGTLRLWDVATAESRAARIGAWVADVAFAPDGASVVAVGADGALWIVRDDLPHDRAALRRLVAERARWAR